MLSGSRSEESACSGRLRRSLPSNRPSRTVRLSDASRLVLDDPRRPSRPRCAFAGLGSWGRRLLARVAPAFDVVALMGSGRPESVAWSVRNYPDVPYLDTLAKLKPRRCPRSTPSSLVRSEFPSQNEL